MEKIIVTGGAGFIGSTFIEECINRYKNIQIVCIDNLSTGKLSNIPTKPNVTLIEKDISNINCKSKDLISICKNADAIFHFAAKARVQPSIQDPVSFNDVNVKGTLNLLELSRFADIKKFIFSSSSSIYGDTNLFPTPEIAENHPLSPYGLQKLIGEQYCRLYSNIHGIDTVCLRYFNVYGDRMPISGAYCLVMGIFTNLKKQNLPLTIYGDGSQRRDFTFVKDVVEANMLAANSYCSNGEVFNIGNGNNVSIKEIADIYDHPIEYKPARLEPFQNLADNSKAKSILGWKPTGNVKVWLKEYLYNNLKK